MRLLAFVMLLVSVLVLDRQNSLAGDALDFALPKISYRLAKNPGYCGQIWLFAVVAKPNTDALNNRQLVELADQAKLFFSNLTVVQMQGSERLNKAMDALNFELRDINSAFGVKRIAVDEIRISDCE